MALFGTASFGCFVFVSRLYGLVEGQNLVVTGGFDLHPPQIATPPQL
jgi:hypothetical protein